MTATASKIFVISVWALGFGALNILTKRLVTSMPAQTGALTMSDFVWTLITDVRLYIIIVLYIICATAYAFSLRIMPLSSAGPMFLILGMVITAALGVWFFDESMSPQKLIGFVFCIAGLSLIL